MRLVFAGTPEFAALALVRLVEAGHHVALVLTQPDRPAGRGLRPIPSAVKQAALQRGLEIHQPEKIRPEDVERVRAARADALVVAAYGLILPQSLLDVVPRGAWNIHASLLPRWRGAAPIQRALLAGDRQTGISIMQMDAGLDTGPVLAQRGFEIGQEDDSGTLHDRLAELGANMMVDALTAIEAGKAKPQAQPATGATYAAKIGKGEAIIDWKRPMAEIERVVRAFRPVPGASTALEGEVLKIWRATPTAGRGEPGEVIRSGPELLIACGEGALQIDELQRAGGKRLSASDFLRGRTLKAGARFG